MNETPNTEAFPDRREARRQRRLARGGGSWFGGLLLIGLAVLLLLQQAGSIQFGRRWALLILIPAIAAFANAWNEYQAAGGQLNRRASGALIGGIVLTLVTAALFFNLDWGWFGPVILLLAGIGFFSRGYANPGRS